MNKPVIGTAMGELFTSPKSTKTEPFKPSNNLLVTRNVVQTKEMGKELAIINYPLPPVQSAYIGLDDVG